MKPLNPDGTAIRLCRHSAKCECGARSEVFLQEFNEVTTCLVCGIRAGKVNYHMIDINRKNYPRPDQVRTPRSDGKERQERERLEV